MSLVFEPEGHTYTWHGHRVPSVTQVIVEAGCLPRLGVGMSWYMRRGSALHLAAQMFDEDDLDEASVDPAIAGHIDAYRAFREFTKDDLEILEIEQPGYHPSGYAGTPDRVISWHGDRGVLDLKTGNKAPWHRLQTAGYLALVPEATVRLVVHLKADGGWKIDRHLDRGDWGVFASARALWQWKERNGLMTG